MNGNPAMAAVPIRNTQWVTGMRSFKPPIFRMSCSPESAWITEPADRNSSALKNACVTKWKIAAMYAPTPHARNMKPS